MVVVRILVCRLVLAAAVVLGPARPPVSALVAQSTEPVLSTTMSRRKHVVQIRVAEIMEETLKRGHGSVQGIRTYTRVPPSPQDVKELRGLGQEAISALTDYALAGSAQKQRLAIELLGRVGGRDIIPPLDRVLRTSPSASLREMALRWLPPEESNEFVRQILIRTAESDSDGQVRTLARRRLAGYAAE